MHPRRTLLLAALPVAALATGIGIWALRTFDPNLPGNPFPPCIFRTITGHYCAGCGITRALHALVHGDMATAIHMNLLAILLLALLPAAFAWHLGWKPRLLQPAAAVLASPWFWGILMPAFWITRNLPWYPFNLLAPG